MGPRRAPDELSTLLRHSFDPTPLPDMAFVLTAIDGPDQGKTYEVGGGAPAPVLVGQSPACDLQLSDRQVSRRHAALEIVGNRLRVTDLDSANGSFVDGLAIVGAFLLGGETLRLGATSFRVERKADAPSVSLPSHGRFGRLIGMSTEMRRLYPLLERLAASHVPVVLEGETGTGKELLAESIHEAGTRAGGPFVVFDCTAVPANLIESELFGHERGAFTGAVASRKGMFEQAQGGTLLIDEIGDLQTALQAKLLRAIERCEVRRLGADKPTRVDVRLLAATRRDLDVEVQAGRFRDDLFHRLAVTRVELPPLRRRRGDIAVLARHFWSEMGGQDEALTRDLVQRWEAYAWPGNVRELRNAVARRLALGALADAADEPAAGHPAEAAETVGEPPDVDDAIERILDRRLPMLQARQLVIEEFQRRYITRVLEEHGGSVLKAAAASGIARRYFQLLRSGKRRA